MLKSISAMLGLSNLTDQEPTDVIVEQQTKVLDSGDNEDDSTQESIVYLKKIISGEGIVQNFIDNIKQILKIEQTLLVNTLKNNVDIKSAVFLRDGLGDFILEYMNQTNKFRLKKRITSPNKTSLIWGDIYLLMELIHNDTSDMRQIKNNISEQLFVPIKHVNDITENSDVKMIDKMTKRRLPPNKEDSKRTKDSDTDESQVSVPDHLRDIIQRIELLEDECNDLREQNIELHRLNTRVIADNRKINGDNITIHKEFQELNSKHSHLIDKFKIMNDEFIILKEKPLQNDVDMIAATSPSSALPQLFSSLFSSKDNKKITEPMAEIIQIISDNDEDKKKRELNLILFGLKVKSDDKNLDAISNLLTKIGARKDDVKKVFFMNKKDEINELAPIKLVTSNYDAKIRILKAARNLRLINENDKTKISICTDMSEIDRSRQKSLVERRKLMNVELSDKPNINYYFGIRNNNIVKIKKNISV